MDLMDRTTRLTLGGFLFNTIYGIGHGVLGIITHSLWLITLSAYYILLSMMRFSVLLYQRKSRQTDDENERFVQIFSGILFLPLVAVLIGTTYLTVQYNIGTVYHEILMIAMATYTFIKITLAIINLCKCRKHHSAILTTLRNISFADAAASVFSLQRSMLVSFGEMPLETIRLFNLLTGIGVCLVVALSGIFLIRKENSHDAIEINGPE